MESGRVLLTGEAGRGAEEPGDGRALLRWRRQAKRRRACAGVSGVLWATASGIGFGLFQSVNRRAIRGIEDPYVSDVPPAVGGHGDPRGGEPRLGGPEPARRRERRGDRALRDRRDHPLRPRLAAPQREPGADRRLAHGAADHADAAVRGRARGGGARRAAERWRRSRRSCRSWSGAWLLASRGSGRLRSSATRSSRFGTAFMWALSAVLTVEALEGLDSPLLGVTLGLLAATAALGGRAGGTRLPGRDSHDRAQYAGAQAGRGRARRVRHLVPAAGARRDGRGGRARHEPR